MIIPFLFVMKLILLTWKGITILPQAIWISLDFLVFLGFFSYIICSFYSVNFPHVREKSSVYTLKYPEGEFQVAVWSPGPGMEKNFFWICFYFDWILAHTLNCIFLCRIRFFNYLDWFVQVWPQKVTSHLLLRVGWKRRLQFRHPVDLSMNQKSFITMNRGSQCNKNCMRVRRRQKKEKHFQV